MKARPGEARAWLAEFLAAPPQTDECILWPFGRMANGYGNVRYEGRTRGVHVVVCEHFHGGKPGPGMDVCHAHTGNRHCINPRHLRWDTRAGNMRDAVEHGTTAWKRPNEKLTDGQVDEIRQRYAAGGVSQSQLAREYAVNQGHVSDIINRKKR